MNFDISPSIGILSALWVALYIAGRWQFSHAKQITTDLVLSEGRRANEIPNPPTVEALYLQIMPQWQSAIKQSIWFIPHKTELFPVPALPRIVQKRLNFTPSWVGAYLTLNGIHLAASPDLKAEIDRIVKLAPKNKHLASK